MTVQVRTFTIPQPLGERLAKSTLESSTPRTIPELLPQALQPNRARKQTDGYTKFPMATYNGSKQAGGITFAAQDSLPKLPIPDLDGTIEKYLRALKPLQSPREHADTQQAAEDFLRTDGPDLQDKLRSYAQGKTSYIEQFCKHILLTMMSINRTNRRRV